MSKNDNDDGVSRYSVIDGTETFTNDRVSATKESERADTARRGGDNTYQVTDQSGRVIHPGAGVTPDMIIRLPDGQGGTIPTTIANALQQGLISRNQDGSYHVDENEIGTDLTPREEEINQPAGEALADRGIENLIDVIARDVTPTDAIGVINDLIEDGAVNPNLLGNVASQLGVMPHEAQSYVNKMVDGFSAQANATVERITGGIVDAQTLYDWARQNDPQALKDAMRSQITERSTAGYRALAATYMKGLDKHQPQLVFDAATAAGLQPSWDSQRKVVVLQLPNGQTMPWKQALEMGVISLSATK